VQIDEKTGTLRREGVESIINPFDEYAIEEAVRIKERLGEGSKVTVISMGPPQAEQALRDALSRGCDEAILISDKSFAGADTLATSYTLSQAIRKIAQAGGQGGGYDLIICGKQASDGDTAQVGPGIAEHLDIPHVAYVGKIEEIRIGSGSNDRGYIRVQRMMEDGHDILEMPLPALITVVKEINVPRLPTLRGMIFAKKAKITCFRKQDIEVDENRIGLDGSPTKVIKIFYPEPRKGGEKFTGEPQHQAKQLVAKLKELQLL
ncbi:MAG: electron transfer flavoprotein subunit beta/FixA family protein, partial [Elusimicrobiota bacterium]|nr:electron transfer flavoprotein subunit beta/FixA family protein [Elusimicrobiota bacterium]